MPRREAEKDGLQAEVIRLTAELEAAERDAQRQKDLGTYEASLKERRLRTAAESRAEALQARVAELEADLERFSHGKLASRCAKLQAELADLRGRVSQAITWLVSARIAVYQHQKNDAISNALAALRGEEVAK